MDCSYCVVINEVMIFVRMIVIVINYLMSLFFVIYVFVCVLVVELNF